MQTNPFRNLFGLMKVSWMCTCGHGVTRHCHMCGVCHVGQSGHKDPFKDWCGCLKPPPVWVRMNLR